MRLEHERSHNLMLINLVRSLPGTDETVFTALGLLLAEPARSVPHIRLPGRNSTMAATGRSRPIAVIRVDACLAEKVNRECRLASDICQRKATVRQHGRQVRC